MGWNDLKTVQKGNYGEMLVDKYVASKRFISYQPVTPGPHAFDRMLTKDKKTLVIAEVKTKPARFKYPDTGINIEHFREYTHIMEKYGIDVVLFFVDQDKRKVYGGPINRLAMPRTITHNGRELNYPMELDGIMYFPLVAMKDYFDISEQDAQVLKNLSTGSYS